MSKNYWLDLFTGSTWDEFLKNGAQTSGFRERRRKLAEKIKPDDYLICYLTGISRIIGILEVQSELFIDKTPIWINEIFPCRFKVKLLYKLEPDTAIPIFEFKDSLSIFKNLKSKRAWSGFFRGSPHLFKQEDGEIILDEIKKVVINPITREYDKKKYLRYPKTYETKLGVVTIPDKVIPEDIDKKEEVSCHREIQGLLLKLGSELGLSVWVARNDRNKDIDGKLFKDIPNLIKELPRQFDDATNRTIELIDVLWLDGKTIKAAFEIEHSSPIYSGLLRMSDLISMQPNINIDLYIVAPDDRREKVISEINRPTFTRLKPSLNKICKYISYSNLKKELKDIGDRIKFMKPEFIDEIAESCETDEI